VQFPAAITAQRLGLLTERALMLDMEVIASTA
jgi:hypothetical protein